MLNTGIFIFNDIETLDFCGPLEVFSAANFVSGNKIFNVYTFAEKQASVSTINGLSINPSFGFQNMPNPDILIIPGGEGSKKVVENKNSMTFLNDLFGKSQFTFTVCSGVRIAAKLGWLKNKKFTTHHTVYNEISALEPLSVACKNLRYTDNGKLLTSAGVSAGI
ncbi:MAG: DJ-1/PfpI family protein, partial [Bacteroidales bacterium]